MAYILMCYTKIAIWHSGMFHQSQSDRCECFLLFLEKGLIDGACKACSAKLGMKQAIEQTGLPLIDDMNGHPGMAQYLDAGLELISF